MTTETFSLKSFCYDKAMNILIVDNVSKRAVKKITA